MATFENYARREKGINECLKKYGLKSLDECRELCLKHGIDVDRKSVV